MRYSFQDFIAFFRCFMYGWKPRIGDCYFTKEDYKKLLKHRLTFQHKRGKGPRPYSCHSYRITGFYKVVPFKPDEPTNTGDWEKDFAAEFRNENRAELRSKGAIGKLIHCEADEADFVSGTGVCGSIRPISDIVVTHTVRGHWPEDHLKEAEDSAARWIERDKEPQLIFDALYTSEDGRIIQW